MGEVVRIDDYIFSIAPAGEVFRRNVMIQLGHLKGHIRRIHLEKEFWIALELISQSEGKSLGEIFTAINFAKKKNVPLSSAAKIFVVNYLLFEKVNTSNAVSILNKISSSNEIYHRVKQKTAFEHFSD